MNQTHSKTLQPKSNSPKHVSFQTQHSAMTSGSTRKKYYLKKCKYSEQKLNQLVNTNGYNKSNIFDLTADYTHTYSQINPSQCHTANQSAIYQNSLLNSQCKQTIQNPQKKITLPIITQSKYNFKPTTILRKVPRRQYHPKAPKYIQDATYKDIKNIRKMKKYHQLWAQTSQLRTDKSLLDRSAEKAQKYIQKHNIDIYNRKQSIQFQTVLRDRHIKQQNRIGSFKPVPIRSLTGLKGKGGSVRSLYQQMYTVEQVYKIDK